MEQSPFLKDKNLLQGSQDATLPIEGIRFPQIIPMDLKRFSEQVSKKTRLGFCLRFINLAKTIWPLLTWWVRNNINWTALEMPMMATL